MDMENTTADKFSSSMELLRRVNPGGYLAVIAVLNVMAINEGIECDIKMPGGYSRGSFKRAIREIRKVMQYESEKEVFEEAIAFIRSHWLHRGVTV